MLLMNAKNIHYSIGERTLLDIKELAIHEGEKIGLVGRNGQGKTMLLRYLSGELEVIPQVKWYTDYDRLDQIHKGPKEEHQSGGERTLAKLDAIFQNEAPLLFLDEPTNDLDWSRMEALEERLQEYSGACVIISHDRTLLDRTCHKIWELENGILREFNGNYSFYLQQKDQEREQQMEKHLQYLQEKKRIENRIEQKRTQSKGMRKPPRRMGNSEWQLGKNKAAARQKKVERTGKTLERRLNRLERPDKPFEWDQVKLEMDQQSKIHSKYIFQLREVDIQAGHRFLFRIDDILLKTGAKTAFIGANGAGKSTFLQHLLDHHKVLFPKGVKTEYFHQNMGALPDEETVLGYVSKTSRLEESMIRIILARLRFYEEDIHKKIQVLSGGERVKLVLARMLVSEAQLLILDEPTNHLDIEAIEALEKLVQDYPGTILYVTHDRTFVEKTADQLWIIEQEKLNYFDGTWQEWQEALNKPQKAEEDVYNLMTLETKLSELISRLSIPGINEDRSLLEKEYEETLKLVKQLKQNS
ncbi:ribosomal protection-like ABC-F family protein [Halobacillus halophilus]|uniref:ribosomal protection-like ABC-F family protein n=1 Tax=Halobacillus halophilus TaxID=1570 RepID=UPI001CD78FB9|nr:ATP-binding cassette domain-containing protein [Halobacillus halophilus]MCA1012150.1 ATP-binding cassette domain-containing protein [Halobacillus halophilus]